MNEKLPISESNPIKARYYDYERFSYPWHFHSQYEIMYVQEGEGECFVGDRIERYRAGDVILFGSNLPHYMRSDEHSGAPDTAMRTQGVIVQFEQNFMGYSFGHYPQLLQISNLLNDAVRGILFPAQYAGGLRSILSDFPMLKGFRQLTSLLELLQEMSGVALRRVMASPHYYESFPVMGDKRIDKILSYVNNNYTRKIKLEEIAEMANMNASAFCRYFKENTGRTLLQYILEMRVGYACRLLTVGSMDISQIALECGFESITHFNRMFKAHTKQTPGQYRSNILK